ncbi:hypothetical protein [Amycolatopsis sp. H20-H5]|uniref:hypothetical protein n=1 Tax=Amycolatopsis sp. H20-H5 TaxID=3046309 RepID=UPI002DB9FC93|nr:hypothetical protein [Amycolatopsis sp. H20-H5]MEC3977845.1 hypothetical protein [Amycolatopsis sp. H20-H5]
MKKSYVATGLAVVSACVALSGVAQASPARAVLSGDGYHGLKLGMSEAGAKNSGVLLGTPWDDGTCDRYQTVDRPDDQRAVALSHQLGVVEERAPRSARTPEGIGAGSTVAQIKRKYADAQSYRNGFTARVPGYADRFYTFWVEGSDGSGNYPDSAKVTDIALSSVSFDCPLLGD